MLLKEICVLNVATCARNATILEAAHLMRQQHTGNLIIVDELNGDKTPAGIITDRDIVVEVLAKGLDPGDTKVGQVMSAKLVIASEDEDLEEAVDRMRLHGVRRLPVVDEHGHLTGVVSLDDMIRLHTEQGVAMAEIIAKEQNREHRTKR